MADARLILASGLTLGLAAIPATAQGPAGIVHCLPAAAVDRDIATAFCAALQDLAPGPDIRAHILATGPAFMSVRLDRVTKAGIRTGLPLDLSVMDRDLTNADLRDFAAEVLRLTPDITTGDL